MLQLSVRRFLSVGATLAMAAGLAVARADVAAAADSNPNPYPVAVYHDVSPPLASLQPENYNFQSVLGNDRAAKPLPRQHNGPTAGAPASATSPSVTAPTLGANFDAIGVGLGSYTVCCAPPDTNAAVGPNHIVETVNLDLAVWQKSTLALLYGPVPINTLWSGFGGGCQTNNDGDPTVVYDTMADRWVISQFSVTTTPYLQCVAVSTGPDPTGSYYRYSFSYGNVDFPDYPKLGVWPDGYYETFNIFANGVSFSGAKVCAYDRSKMLTGALATQQCFNTSSLYGGLLPSTLNGTTPPPAGSPNYLVALDAPVTSNLLQYWKFHVDWTTPANTTFTGPTSITVASYTNSCNTLARGDCIPQGGTTQKLESLADRAMYPLNYRNFGDHEALVVNHTIEVGSGSSLHSGVRWYELRPSGGNLTLFQQGTYAPDSNWRWMGSANLDKSGNIGLGYSGSSPSISPQIHFTGRLATDPAGTMTQGENVIIDGGGSQTGGLARWGDYSSMWIDPTDGCTFWYSNEYLKTSGSFNWSTRIASFKLPSCGSPDFAIAATPSSQTVVQGSSTTYTVSVTPSGGFSGTVNFSPSGLPSGATASFNPASVTASGNSTMTVTTSASTPTGSYPLTITGTSGTLTRTASVTLVVNAPPTPDFSIAASPSSQTVVQGGSTTYTATVTYLNGFTGTVTFSLTGLPAGASGVFNPTSVTNSGSSTLTVSTGSSTPAGSYSLTITGTSGTLSHSTSVTLNVGDFSLSASPSSATVTQGSSASYTLTVTRTNFTAGVTLSVSGLPSGATGTFSPNPATGTTSTLSVTTSSTTPAGTYPLTITGTGGSPALTRTTSVSLTVSAAPAQDFSLSATPTTLTLTQSQRGSYTVTITRTGGFAGSVSLSVSGQGSGTTATFSPNPTTGNSSTLSISESSTAATGTFTLTITGTSGGLTRTVQVTLIVNPTPPGGCDGDCG